MLEQILLELALLFALCVGVATTFHRLRLPPIVGFLCAGVIVGPHGVGLVHHEETVRQLAEVGVVVLLFAAGLEMPITQLARLRRVIALGGSLQIGGTVLFGVLLGLAFGSSWQESLFLGCLLSLSSTAAASKMLLDHGEFSAPHGRFVMGIAIAQDLAVVPMILLVPLLGAGHVEGHGSSIGVLPGVGILIATLVAVRLLLPRVVNFVCNTRSRELFVLLLATLCLGMAAVTAKLGMSLALGAFFAGILLADSDHHSLAAAEVEPFKDAFASLFFVSIGMLFDFSILKSTPGTVAAMLVLVIAGKAGLIMLAARMLGQPFWVCLRAGSALAQVGEFSFVLVQAGRGRVLDDSVEGLFVIVAVLSIALTPVFYGVVRTVAAKRRQSDRGVRSGGSRDLEEHAIVVGYGPTGRAVVQGLQALGIPAVVSELNAATVRAEKAKGVPIVLGDATRVSVLRSLGIDRARILVLAVNDGAAARRIAQLAQQVQPSVHVIARTVYIAESDALQRAGAHEVVPQELEASVEILVRVLRRFLVADDEIGRRVREARAVHGGSDRLADLPPTEAARIAEFVPGIGFRVFAVSEGSPVARKSLQEVGVRRRTGCSVVAVRRGDRNLPLVEPETVLEPGDTVVVLGPEERLTDAAAMFAIPAPVPTPN
ncbi:MAG: cation:proton antiporter [bacterium]|nr:cation:proton antiporter [bacterium]